jgi:hypothetical protein
MYVFDTTPMWIAILLFNLFHPGRFMPGKEGNFPSRKEYKREKEEKKERKRQRRGNGLFERSSALEDQTIFPNPRY